MGTGLRCALLPPTFAAVVSLSACSGYPLDALPIPTDKPADHVELVPNADIELPVPGQKFANRAAPIAEPDKAVAEVDWKNAAPVRIMLLEYTFAPHEMVLNEGTAYRLVLSNIGDKDHTFKAPSFFRAIAVRSLSTIPIDEVGLLKYEREDAGQSAPPQGLLRLELEEIPPPPPLGADDDDAGAAPANPFDSGDDEDEAPAGTNPFDSGDEEDIGDEDDDASLPSVPGRRYAADRRGSQLRGGAPAATRRSNVSEVTSVDAAEKPNQSIAPQLDEIEDDLPAEPERNRVTRRSRSEDGADQNPAAPGPLLAQQLTDQESEIEDDDFVYRPGTNAPIKPAGAVADDEDEVEASQEGEPAGVETEEPTKAASEPPPATGQGSAPKAQVTVEQKPGAADDAKDETEDVGEDVTEDSAEDSDDELEEETGDETNGAEATDTAETDASEEPVGPAAEESEAVEEASEESAAEDETAAKLPPLPRPRATPAEETAEADEADEDATEDSEDDTDAAQDDTDAAEDEDLADLEDDALDEEEDGDDGEAGDSGTGPAPAATAADDEERQPAGATGEATQGQTAATADADEAPELIAPEILASLLEKGVIEVPARRSKLIHFVAVRKGRYDVSTLSFIDNAHWMRGTIIIE